MLKEDFMKKLLLFTFSAFIIGILNLNSQTVVLTEGFESGIPATWSQEYVTLTIDWDTDNGGQGSVPNAAHTGSGNAKAYKSYGGSVTKLVTPEMDLTTGTNPTLTFWHAQAEWFGDQDELRVYYKTSSGGSWTLITGAEWIGNISAWTERTFTLPNPSSTYYIAFEATTGYGHAVVLDDVEVTVTSAPMTYSSSAVTQPVTTEVNQSTTNNEVIQLEVITSGASSPLNITDFYFNTGGTPGTDNPTTNIENAKLWSGATFATASQK
jgi:hypothetical protein